MYYSVSTCTRTLDLPNISAALFDRTLARGEDREYKAQRTPSSFFVWCDTASAKSPIENTAAEAAVVGLKGKAGRRKPGHSNPRVSRLDNQLVLFQETPLLAA